MPLTISPYLTLPLRTLSEVLRARAERITLQPIGQPAGAEIIVFPERPSRRGFLRIGAAAAAVVAAITGGATSAGATIAPIAVQAGTDPVLDLIAEHKRWERLLIEAHNKADTAFFALPDKVRRPCLGSNQAKLDLPCGALYREVIRLDAIADELWERISETRAVTIEGAIAQLQLLELDPPEVVIAGLQDIAAKRGVA